VNKSPSSSGLQGSDNHSHDSSYLGPRAAQPDDPRSVTRSIRELPVAVPIRSKFIYCNIMYTVASYLVEKKSALSFSDFLQENFFRPLAMNSTHLQPEQSRANGLSDLIATGYSWDKEKEAYKGGFQSPDAPEAQGAGSIISSVSDYIKWVKAMMNNENPITLEVYKGLTKARIIENPSGEEGRPLTSPIAYAAGWEISYYRGYQVIKHDGSIPGFGTCHFFVPDFKFGGAIFGNSGGAGTISSILMRELIDQALNVPQAERLDWNKIESEADSDNDEDDEEKLREELCPGITSSQPQELSLDAYIGEYSNPGYHSLTVKVNDGKLFIDATDRSMGFTLTFDHVCEQTKYIVHMSDSLEGGDIPFKAEFNLDSGKATKMGLHFEDELKEYIWFNRV
jgi:CubicO group peptidase (beta-lactamase class C family)